MPYLWLLVFFLIPFLIVLKISFAEFSPWGARRLIRILSWAEEGAIQLKLQLGAYSYLLHEPLYVSAWLYSLKVAAVSTIFCLLIGYPMAYAIARSSPTGRNIYLMLVILPFWTSFLLRVYAWIGLAQDRRCHQQRAAVAAHHQRAAGDDEHQLCRVHRHRLFLPAVHDPAAVFEPGKA